MAVCTMMFTSRSDVSRTWQSWHPATASAMAAPPKVAVVALEATVDARGVPKDVSEQRGRRSLPAYRYHRTDVAKPAQPAVRPVWTIQRVLMLT
jgi:hypothetical protein